MHRTLRGHLALAGSNWLHNIQLGCRVAAGRPVAPGAFVDTAGQVALAFLVLWTVIVLGQYLVAGSGATFWVWGLAGDLAACHLWVLAVLAVIWWHRAWASARDILIGQFYTAAAVIAVLGLVVVLTNLVLGPEQVIDGQLLLGASLGWMAVSVFAVSRHLPFPATRAARIATTLAYAVSLLAIARGLPHPAMFYVETSGPAPLDVESIYYRQPELVDAQTAVLAPQRADEIDMYYVGFAPFATEDVFVREIEASREIVARRLDLAGRSLNLANHRSTLSRLPLANLPNLRRTLTAVGAHIDRDEDIVFLYLSSHGYEEGALAAEFETLAPNVITAGDLRLALDEAGILWRVVVISACYSGSFIEQLRSPTTLLVTAAAADRASFGCAHENQWTYFGEAFFVDALSQTTDLLEAARLAQESIRAREEEENKKPSLPQLIAGERIVEQLSDWRRGPPLQP